jgi:uncharacterized protein
MPVQLKLLSETFAVCRFAPQTFLEGLIPPSGFFALTRTEDELSLVVEESFMQPDWKAELNWRGLKVLGPLDFSLIGILSSLAQPLKAAGVSIFAVSTYDTDYLFVKEDKLPEALKALWKAGFLINEE